MSLIAATQLTAVATAALAVFAIVTALFALLTRLGDGLGNQAKTCPGWLCGGTGQPDLAPPRKNFTRRTDPSAALWQPRQEIIASRNPRDDSHPFAG